jgi:hypothetical protein
VTVAPQPEEQPVPGLAPTELKADESPDAPQPGRTRISAAWFGWSHDIDRLDQAIIDC